MRLAEKKAPKSRKMDDSEANAKKTGFEKPVKADAALLADVIIADEKIIEEIDSKEVEIVSEEAIKEVEAVVKPKTDVNISAWAPKTEVGKKVKSGEITNIDEILDSGYDILEAEIVDALLPNTDSELLMIGQSKGKFGGGQKRAFRQTQKKTMEGNKPSFAALAVIGDNDGHIGFGYGKARETVPAREKAFRNAKLNIIKIRRGCGSWQCNCGTSHTVPFKVSGKCGAVEVVFMPAPKGTGLRADSELAKILKLAGIKDVWSKTIGKSRTKLNHVFAAVAALKLLSSMKIMDKHNALLSITEGKIVSASKETEALSHEE
jgi:small subunit ribosomal protein S5